MDSLRRSRRLAKALLLRECESILGTFVLGNGRSRSGAYEGSSVSLVELFGWSMSVGAVEGWLGLSVGRGRAPPLLPVFKVISHCVVDRFWTTKSSTTLLLV